MGQFFEISIAYYTLYLRNEDGDPQFLSFFFFCISFTSNSLSACSKNLKNSIDWKIFPGMSLSQACCSTKETSRRLIWKPCSSLQIFQLLIQTSNNSTRTWYLALVISNRQSFHSNFQTLNPNTLSFIVTWNLARPRMRICSETNSREKLTWRRQGELYFLHKPSFLWSGTRSVSGS